jgi:hypothetical protein
MLTVNLLQTTQLGVSDVALFADARPETINCQVKNKLFEHLSAFFGLP